MAVIGDMDTSSPTGADPVSGGDDELVGIKVDVTGSFPNFGDTASGTGITTKTGPQIDDAPEKLEAETISGIWTFSTAITSTGVITLANDTDLVGRNQAGNSDIALVTVSTSDTVLLGDAARSMTIRGVSIGIIGDTSTTGDVTIGGQLRQDLTAGGQTGPIGQGTPSSLSGALEAYDASGAFIGYVGLFRNFAP